MNRMRISPQKRRPRGFTMVELLVVMLIIALLVALLLPAINGALRTAKNAAVGGEINQLAQALASFKARYGDYPPSRVFLAEDGDYSGVGSNASLSVTNISQDITAGQLVQRSLAALRKFFPSVTFSTAGRVFAANSTQWYDFNGNGVFDGHYILSGHECLVFFLGGIPQITASGFGMSGFAKNPSNPFVNTNVTTNRQVPFFEFNNGRLALDPYAAARYPNGLGLVAPQMPGYLDSLGNVPPTGNAGEPINFYAYFNAYGNGGYDPNDVNFPETDVSGVGSPIGLSFHVAFPVFVAGTNTSTSGSPAPNPYTSALTAPFNGNVPLATTYLNPQSFQIISSGIDGLYGVGGRYAPDSATEALPYDSTTVPNSPYINTTSLNIRKREQDNVTNVHNGRLE
jgi:general secretion pathway protein G